ncbi:hypothetical protein GCM10011588_47390 [Nocardia jinanensis]|uniref:Uncharacterized protein n=1 Tax=Nocardia jinanensis TaxID=382504 RepID=A0A917VX17_9NOCA|nr:hypothetical protein GCM10011588_47390 [Nocardia jinanensis]
MQEQSVAAFVTEAPGGSDVEKAGVAKAHELMKELLERCRMQLGQTVLEE